VAVAVARSIVIVLVCPATRVILELLVTTGVAPFLAVAIMVSAPGITSFIVTVPASEAALPERLLPAPETVTSIDVIPKSSAGTTVRDEAR
jgi:hypothetical protein